MHKHSCSLTGGTPTLTSHEQQCADSKPVRLVRPIEAAKSASLRHITLCQIGFGTTHRKAFTDGDAEAYLEYYPQ